ncbi:hypothetical protein BsWGS_19796 [Bradybaena similaris]
MAESGDSANNNSWESWLGGWVQTAKEKSSTALEMVKKDLAEFTCTIHRDTERAVEITKESLNTENTTHATNRVKAGLTSFLDNISRALVIPPDDDYIPVKVAPDGSGLYDRGKARLHAIQLDASTYMDPPDGPPEQYNKWLQSFEIDQHKGEISELLVSKVEVRALYTKLVPSEVSHAEFWQRYFYRVHKLDCDEARKLALMKRADEARGDSFSWDDDDDWSGNEEDNHSDWEKLPRPTQSTAASPLQKPDKKPENVSVEKSTQKVASDSHAVSSHADCCESDMNKPTVKSVNKQTVESNMSAIAASSAQSKDEPTPESTVPARLFPEPVASQEGQDASTDLLSQDLHLMPSADLWSLHIPNDIASASHTQQDMATGVVEPVSSLDVNKQAGESRNTSGESNSWAAGCDDFSAVTDEKPPLVLADGACGIVDIGEGPTSPQQASGLCSDISAASVEISAEPYLAQAEAVSCHSVSAAEELADLSETVSDVASAFSSEAKDQPVPEPVSANPVAAVTGSAPANPGSSVTEVAPTADKVSLNKENIAESPVATVLKESNVSQETSDDSKKEIDSSSDNVELSDRKESVLLSDAADGEELKEIAMRLKGDMIVVGDRDSPLSSESTGTKEMGLEEDWEQDFDIEITEDDLKSAENIAKQLGENLNAVDDDWENWE